MVAQTPTRHGPKGVVKSTREMKHALGKRTGSSAYQSYGKQLRQGYTNAWTYGCRNKTRSRTGSLSDGELPVWFSELCKKYQFLSTEADVKTRSRPSLV